MKNAAPSIASSDRFFGDDDAAFHVIDIYVTVSSNK